MAAENPYTAVVVSGYNSSPPPDDGTRDSTNQLTWAFHTAKIGDPLKTGVEAVDTNVSAAFGDLIMTTDPGQETVVTAMRQFMPRTLDPRLAQKRITDQIPDPLSMNHITINAVFS